jgi:hypothetical protein
MTNSFDSSQTQPKIGLKKSEKMKFFLKYSRGENGKPKKNLTTPKIFSKNSEPKNGSKK